MDGKQSDSARVLFKTSKTFLKKIFKRHGSSVSSAL